MVVSVPLARVIASAVRNTDHVVNVLTEVETDDGLTGLSYVAGFTPHEAAAISAVVTRLAEVVHGCDAAMIGALWDQMRAACTLGGHAGIACYALSALDIALWDLQGKSLGVPLHRLLGTRRSSIPAYASDGCWLDDDPGAAADEAAEFASAGFNAVKIRLGRVDPAQDMRVVQAVRRTLGDSIAVLADVNQAWSRDRARYYGRRLEPYGVEWLEEPLPAEDVEGLTDLRRELTVPIAAGENAHMLHGIRMLIEQRAVSVLTPDLQRVGGITGWLRAGALAEAWHVPITAHLFPEVSVHLLASSVTPGPLEWVTWMAPLLEEPLTQRNGVVAVPDRPGLGMSFDRRAVERYRLE